MTTLAPSRRVSPAPRRVLVGVLLAAVLLAFGVRGLLAARVVQARAVALLKAGQPAAALDEADLRLSRQPDDPHLRNVAVAAARAHVDLLRTERRPVGDVAAWLAGQLERRPYLRKALAPDLEALRAEEARAPGAPSGATSSEAAPAKR